MKRAVQGLGWFLRRTKEPVRLGAFYTESLGLPRLRSWQLDEHAGAMLWAGQVGVLETNVLAESAICDPGQSQCIPIFRTYDPEATRARIAAAGGRLDRAESDDRGTTHMFTDPDGYPFGVEFVEDVSKTELDARLAAAWETGPDSLPGGVGIDGFVQSLSRVIHLTPDPESEADFLVELLGLSRLPSVSGHPLLSLGTTTLLEVQHSNVTLTRPTDRLSVPDSWIVREYSHEALASAARDLAGDPVDSLQFKGGELEYFCTPSNRLFGFQERRPYDPDETMTQMVEDLVSRSLWLAQS